MILTQRDVPILPRCITFSKAAVRDRSLGMDYPINQVGYDMLQLVDGDLSIGEIAEKVAQRYDVPYEKALEDVKSFFYQLNQANVLNIKHKSRMYNLKVSLYNFRKLKFKTGFETLSIRQRYDFSEKRTELLARICFMAFCIAHVFKFHLLNLFILLFLIPGWGWFEAGFLTATFFISIILHESSHLFMLYSLSEDSKLGYLTRSLGTVGIVRNPTNPNKEILISLFGPLVPVVTGLALLGIGFYQESQLLVFTSFFFLSHLSSFFSEDGKNMLKAIHQLERKRSGSL